MKKENNLVSKEEKSAETKKKEAQKILASVNRLALVIGKDKKFICSWCGQQKRITMAFVDKDWKEICLCWDCATPKVLESFLGKEYLEKMRKEWEAKLQRFELNPLSIAKYFYEQWKVSDPVIMQRLIYFAYLEILKEKDIVLFEEKFQAWPGGPVLESVIYPMYENCEDLKKFFAKVEEIEKWNNIIALEYLKRVAKKYLNIETSQVYREVRNKLWLNSLDDERDNNPINENNLFVFVQESRRQPLSAR